MTEKEGVNNEAEKLNEIVDALSAINNDPAVPKSVREKVKNSIETLNQENLDLAVKINKSLQELEEITENQGIPAYTKTQIWGAVSLLESVPVEQ
ncbi:MAG: UPF0147 family protein [Candidatus Woesearchaeota archaeon]|nr:MAG: UPF0147 family protein [Candidatus Woesearchaeota archaeon]